MDAGQIKKANDPQLTRLAIKHHWLASEKAYESGNFDEARMHRRLVDSLRDQLRLAGVLDRSQAFDVGA